jgi:hypothetical protein
MKTRLGKGTINRKRKSICPVKIESETGRLALGDRGPDCITNIYHGRRFSELAYVIKARNNLLRGNLAKKMDLVQRMSLNAVSSLVPDLVFGALGLLKGVPLKLKLVDNAELYCIFAGCLSPCYQKWKRNFNGWYNSML